MKISELVYVRPSCSLRFGGRWGVVSDCDTSNELPIRVLFEDDAIEYGFTTDELVSISNYFDWFQVDTNVLNYKTGLLSKVKERHYPWIKNYKGDLMYVGDCFIIYNCKHCKNLIVGEYGELCEECEFVIDEVQQGDTK